MKFLCATALVLCSADSAWPAKDRPRPDTLTPHEIAEGWLLLFDGETTFGWKVKGQARVEDGVLVLGGDRPTTAECTSGFDQLEARLDFRWKAAGGGGGRPRVSWWDADAGVSFPPPGWQKDDWGRGVIRVKADGDECRLQSPPGDVASDVASLKRDLPHRGAAGSAHITFHVPAGTRLELRAVTLRPMGLKTIFNGKDLSGWKEIPGKRSKFTVTAGGELNVKDGPGDLQTVGQWDDFVLQLDVYSNGDHLNSGVFFRCIPGAFWSGYEAQVRNQWQGDDRTRPVDYGTGGIYNRQPARKVVSSDREWFTMTVAAEGNHLAVWVNGYQTADFADTRPPNPSARKGSKTGKGPVSLQGHDRTTDLRFRYIRIAGLPSPAK
jgi:hypothetical protein